MAHDMVAQALANPGRLPFLALGEWARLLRHAQRSQLLARVAVSAFGHQADGSLPQQPRQQLERVQQATVRQRQQRRLDLLDLMRLIAPIGVDIVALKGTAHWLCDIGPTNDSQFAELDIWVERSSCERLQALLLANGWTRVDWPTPGEPLQTRWSGPPGASDHSDTTLNLHCQMLPALPCADAGLAQQVAARQAVPLLACSVKRRSRRKSSWRHCTTDARLGAPTYRLLVATGPEQFYGAGLDPADVHAFQSLHCPVPAGGKPGGDDLGQPEILAGCAAMHLALADGPLQPGWHTETDKTGAVFATIPVQRAGHIGPNFRGGIACGLFFFKELDANQ